jgi:hypothetical protein
VESLGLVGSNMEDPAPSPQPSPRPESGGLVPSAGGNGDELPTPPAGGGGETTRDEPSLEGYVPPADPAKELLARPSVDEPTQSIAVVAVAGGGVHGLATDPAGETEAPAWQASPGT